MEVFFPSKFQRLQLRAPVQWGLVRTPGLQTVNFLSSHHVKSRKKQALDRKCRQVIENWPGTGEGGLIHSTWKKASSLGFAATSQPRFLPRALSPERDESFNDKEICHLIVYFFPHHLKFSILWSFIFKCVFFLSRSFGNLLRAKRYTDACPLETIKECS